MKKILIVLFIFVLLSACAAAQRQHPWLEKQDSSTRAMLEQYGATEEYLKMQDEMDRIIQNQEQAEQKERSTRLIIIGVSLLAAVWTFVSGIRTFRQAEGKTRGGMIIAISILIAGCGVIFAFNYGVLMFRHKAPEAFNLILAFGIVIALLILAIILLRKKPGDH